MLPAVRNELSDIFSDLELVHQEVDRLYDAQFGFVSVLRDTQSYRDAAKEFGLLAGKASEGRLRLESLRMDAQLPPGQVDALTAIHWFSDALEGLAERLRHLCERAWRARAFDEEYPKAEYRSDLRQMTESKIGEERLRERAVERLEAEGIIYHSIEVRSRWIFIGGAVGLGLGIAAQSWVAENTLDSAWWSSPTSHGALALLVLIGLAIGFVAGTRRRIEKR